MSNSKHKDVITEIQNMKHFTKLLSTLKEKQMQEGYSKCRDKPVRKKQMY